MAALQHKEAFCLMWYACKCGHRERIWNSRDGVTPFCCDCPSCGSMHIPQVTNDPAQAVHTSHLEKAQYKNLRKPHHR